MGLKDELVVANNPPEETGMSESDTTVAEEVVSASPSVSSSAVSVQSEATEEETANEEPEPEEEEEEEVVDPMDALKEECSQHSEAQHLKDVWDECTERVSGKSNTTETCTQEIYDFLHHVDHCVSKTIFSHLK